jgi:photosystem II stability/assembly factor-like uncharacterized protein
VTSKGTAPVREPSDAELIRRRAAWFHDQRAFPLGFIPAGARLRALEQLRQMKAAQQQTRQFQTFGTAAAGDPPWTPVGPQPSTSPDFAPFVSGRVTALAVNPSSPNNVYLGAAQGGVWKTTDGGTTWTPLTDSQPSLAVGSLAVDPSTCTAAPAACQTIYVGTGEENFAIDSYYGAGVLKSMDGGTTWTQDNTFKALIPISSRSSGPRIGALAIHPVNRSILLAAVQGSGSTLQSGVWRSTDGGMSWTHVLPIPTGIVATDVVFDRADLTGNTAYAALGNFDASGGCNGVYKSADAGATWGTPGTCGGAQLIPGSLASQSSFGRIALGIGPPVAPSTAGELFAAIANAATGSDDLLGVFKSTNGGATWSQLSGTFVTPATGFCNGQCFYDLVIRVDPGNPNFVFAGGAARNATLIRSTDGGSTWAEVSNNRTTNTGLHVDMHALAFSSNGAVLYAGNDGGVWSTTSPTGTIAWTNLNQTLGITQFDPGLSPHPSNPAFRSFGGTQDNGLQRYMGGITGNPLQWDDTGTLGDGGFTAIDPNFPSTVYAASEFVPGPFPFLLLIKSVQNGDGIGTSSSFFALTGTGDIINDPRGNFIPPFVIDPSNPQNLYFGTFRVWRSTNGGNTFNAISLDLTGGCSAQSGTQCLSAIAVAPMNSSVVYTGSGLGQVNVTKNAGGPGAVNWTNVSLGLPPRAVTQAAVDPNDATGNTAYVTFSGFSGFNGDTHGHVFQTTTGGTAWLDISSSTICPAPQVPGPLPNIPVNDIVIDPDVAGRLYAATDIGLLQGDLQTLGACWQPLGTGLPNVAVLSLKLDRAARQLFAATHGRSVWEQQLPLPAGVTFNLATINPASASVGGAAFPLTVTGNGFTSSSVVKWTINGAPDTLTPTSTPTATQFSVTVPPKDLGGGGVAQVQVATDSTLTTLSNLLLFTVLNPAPTVTSISPATSTAPAAADLALTINGTNFNSSSIVQLFQLSPLASGCVTSSLVSSSQLNATVLKSCLQFGGTFVVVVNNPPPGGGSSCPNPDPLTCPASNLLVVTAVPPPNDNIANAAIVGSSPYTTIVDSSGATVESTDPSLLSLPCVFGDVPAPAQSGHAKSVWYKATAAGAGGMIEADTIGSAYDTILSVWTGTPGSLMNVACNDDINPGVNRVSQLTFTATGGTTYFFLVSAFEGDGGKTVFNFTGNVVPSVNYASAASPTTATVKAGQSTCAPNQSTCSPIMVTLTPSASSPGGTVALSCSGLPAKSSCNFSSTSSSFTPPNMVMLSPSPPVTSVTVSLTISTTATSGAFPLPPGPATRLPLYAPWLSLAAMALLFSLWVRRRSARKGFVFGFACAFLLLALLVFQVSCGGGGSSGPTIVPGTPPGTYPIAIIGSPSSGGGQAPPTVTLTVTP